MTTPAQASKPSIITDPHNVPSMDFHTYRGTPFMVLADPAGDLTEFWDLRHPGRHFILPLMMPGQFVTRYSISTLLERHPNPVFPPTSYAHGLRLDPGSPSWSVDPAAMALVYVWLDFTVKRALTPFAPTATD